MARNGWVNRLLDMIGLVDDGDEPQQERNDRSRQSSSGSGSARSSSFGSGSRYSSRNEEGDGSGARRRDDDNNSYSSYRSNFERSASAGRTYSTRTEEQQDDRDDLEKAFDNMGSGSSSSRQRTSGPRRAAQTSSAAGTQTRTAQHGSAGTKIHHVNMRTLEECRGIIRDLAEGSVVIVNLENIDDRLLQRALDTLGGAACALHQWMEPVGDRMYMIGSKAVQFDHNYDYSRTMDDRYDR